jgi:hypothetical protein
MRRRLSIVPRTHGGDGGATARPPRRRYRRVTPDRTPYPTPHRELDEIDGGLVWLVSHIAPELLALCVGPVCLAQ